MTPESPTGRLPDETRLGRTALRAENPERLADFYRGVVGLDVLARDGERWTLGAGETPLLVVERAETRTERTTSSAGIYHNAFRVPSRSALGDALRRIRTDWRLDGASDHGVSEALYLTDPEGNGVEIYRDYPREGWPTREDGTVAMVTEPLDLDAVAGAATDGGAGTGDGSAGTGDGDGSRAPPDTDLGHVHLEVTDLDAAETFYVDGLGFDLQATYPGACFVGSGGYHHHVGANTWEGRTAPAPESGPGLAWFEIVLPAEGDLEALRSRLDEHEVTVDGTDDGFAVEDPDGIRIRFRTAR